MSRRSPEHKYNAFRAVIDIVRESGTEPTEPFYREKDLGWILFGPKDVRGGKRKWRFHLQFLREDRTLRVLAGCRYYTIEQAWRHWDPRRFSYTQRRNECLQARAIIQLMLLQAEAHGLLAHPGWRGTSAKMRLTIPVIKRRR